MAEAKEPNPDEIEFIARKYKDDLYGYRRDVLHRDHEDWQKEVGLSVQQNRRTAISSGHGIGKTAFLADTIHWFIATRPHPAIVATANTEKQLYTKLWRELAKVNLQAENGAWFKWKQEKFSMFDDPTQQANALAWSEDNPQAFAGTHEDHVLGVFDEASGIHRSVFNVWAGAMTTPGARSIMAGNMERNEGYFYDANFGKLKARRPEDLSRGLWKSFVIPSWASTRVDAAWLEEMKMTLGEGTDEYRIRVEGKPPRFDKEQFIQRDLINDALEREIEMFDRWPLIIGCDVGRGDRSTMVPRRGRVAMDGIRVLRKTRTMDFARYIAEEINFYDNEYGLFANCVVEDLGMGVGVIEALEDMGYEEHIHGINTGMPATNSDLYQNLRAEMWYEMKIWLEGQVQIPNHQELIDDLLVIKRKPTATGKLRLETKEEMRRRSVPSPDVGDGLALTFALPFDLLPAKEDAWAGAFRNTQQGHGTWMAN